MNNFHRTAIISDKAKIGKNVTIGAYSIIGDNVVIGDNNLIKSHVVIDGFVTIKDNNTIYPFASIGQDPQDLKFSKEKSEIFIGSNNKIREYVTIHPGTMQDKMMTKIGNNCLFMVSSHIAHDCVIGNNVVLANNATLAGHVVLEDDVIIGGLSAVKQFITIGKNAIIGGMSGVENNIIPYATVMGERAFLAGINLVGLKRKSVDRGLIHSLRKFYKELFQSNHNNLSLKDRASILSKKYNLSNHLINDIINFINSHNPIATPK